MTRDPDLAAQCFVEGRPAPAPFTPRERHPRLHELGSPRPHKANMAQGGGAAPQTSPTPSDDDLTIPPFLRRGHPDCIVKGSG